MKLGKIILCFMISVGLFLNTNSAEAVIDATMKNNLDANTEIFKKGVERYLPEINSAVLSPNVLDFFQFVYNRYLFVATIFLDSRCVNDKDLIYYISHSLCVMEEYLCERKVQKNSVAYQLINFTFGGLSQLCFSILEISKGNFCVACAMHNASLYYFKKFIGMKFPESHSDLKFNMDKLLKQIFISGTQDNKIFPKKLQKVLDFSNSDSQSKKQVVRGSFRKETEVSPVKKSKLSETDHGSVGVVSEEISSSVKSDSPAQTRCCISAEEAMDKEKTDVSKSDVVPAESQDTSVTVNPLEMICRTEPVDISKQKESAVCNHEEKLAGNISDSLNSRQEQTPILSFEREVFGNFYEDADMLYGLPEFSSVDLLEKEYEFFEFIPSEIPQNTN